MAWLRKVSRELFGICQARSRSRRRSGKIRIETLEQRVVPATANLTAFRPVTDHFGYTNFPVAENQEESHTLGPGIRINGDDDNYNGLADRTETFRSYYFNDNDLLRVDVAVTGGTGKLNFSPDLRVWTGQQKQAAINNGATITSGTVWVEYVSLTHTTAATPATLNLSVTDAGGTAADKLVLHSFQSIVVAIGGYTQNPANVGDPTLGVFNTARTLYSQGYDVQMHAHSQVYYGGYGAAYNEVVSAVRFRNVDFVAIIGFSWGVGATADLAQGLQTNYFIRGQYTLSYTAAIDGITPYSLSSERRLPAGTGFHDNMYQRRDPALRGNSVTGANNLNVSETAWGSSLIHTTIDDHPLVQDRIISNLIARVVR